MKAPGSSKRRVGNGPGIGGPAKGAGWGGEAKGAGRGSQMEKPFTGDEPLRGAILDNADDDEQSFRLQQRAKKRDRIKAAWDALDALVANPESYGHMSAIKETLDRTEGKPVQKTELTGADGGPVRSIGITTSDPVEAARMYQQIINGGT